MKKKAVKITLIVVSVLVALALAAGWVHFAFLYSGMKSGDSSYLSSDIEVEKILRGILINNSILAEGEECDITYDFDAPEYAELKEKYSLESIAGEGSELEKCCRLMHAFAPRLEHGGSYSEDGIKNESLALLEYCLDRPGHSINCRCKAQLFGEMCLSLGIYTRKLWIMPYSELDDECHVVNEVFDTTLNKWVMLDFTNELYFTDEAGVSLSVTEIRQALIDDRKMIYMTTDGGDAAAIPESDITATRLYYLKNTAYFSGLRSNTYGETKERCYLVPAAMISQFNDVCIFDEESFNLPPEALR